MSDRKAVTCSCGRRFTTSVRGRGTHCPGCRKRVYIRVDGTVRPVGAARPGAGPVKGKPAKTAPAAVDQAPAEPYVPFDDILAGTAPDSVIEARTMWEMNEPNEEGPGLSVAAIGDEFGMSASAVRRRIAAEKRRQELEARATAAG